MQLKLAVVAAFTSALLVAAQDTVIVVGAGAGISGGPFQFVPATVNATKGSTVTFRFATPGGNHSIVQSSFSLPCDALPGGFDSGFVSIPASPPSDLPEWKLTITDDADPIYFFCKQTIPGVHCPMGMVGAINPGDSFQSFLSAAKSFTGTISQTQGALTGSGASASAFPGPIKGGASLYNTRASTGGSPTETHTTSKPTSTSGGGGGGGPYGGGGSNAAHNLGVNGMLIAAVFGFLGLAVVLV